MSEVPLYLAGVCVHAELQLALCHSMCNFWAAECGQREPPTRLSTSVTTTKSIGANRLQDRLCSRFGRSLRLNR